jgi:PIN domain nuclease of toxin-antitoxin system
MLTSSLTTADRLVMDTHVWVWVSGEAGGVARLQPSLLPSIEQAARDRRLYVSAASTWEIALKAERGQALISGDLDAWVRDQRQYPGVRVLSIDSQVAIDCTRLPHGSRARDGQEHRDPNDRFIVTTARRLNAVLLTCDEEILHFARQGHVRAFDSRP